ncbi:hypothetical protein JL722_3585 [Aureococcus anophagefferens]|nr:hypothetical protein JL722_3585 [Aureococcus anophagefferens]
MDATAEALAHDTCLEFELPRGAIAKAVAKWFDGVGKDDRVHAAIARAGGLFSLYLTAAAVQICKDNKRQTISPQDVRPKHAPTLKKYRGVYQGSINAWYSQISIAGQPIHLGSFAAPEDAARAYDRAIWSKLGTAAASLLNFPDDIPEYGLNKQVFGGVSLGSMDAETPLVVRPEKGPSRRRPPRPAAPRRRAGGRRGPRRRGVWKASLVAVAVVFGVAAVGWSRQGGDDFEFRLVGVDDDFDTGLPGGAWGEKLYECKNGEPTVPKEYKKGDWGSIAGDWYVIAGNVPRSDNAVGSRARAGKSNST